MPLNDDERQHALRVEQHLRSLAGDIVEHEACDGCRYNAAAALEMIGSLDDALERFGIEDPRITQERKTQERLAAQSPGPPRLDVQVHVSVNLAAADTALERRVYDAIQTGISASVDRMPEATVVGMMLISKPPGGSPVETYE